MKISEQTKNDIAERALAYFNITQFYRHQAFSFLEDMIYRGVIVLDDHARSHVAERCASLHLPRRTFERFWDMLDDHIRQRWSRDMLEPKKKSPDP